jgi:hypothetical protein
VHQQIQTQRRKRKGRNNQIHCAGHATVQANDQIEPTVQATVGENPPCENNGYHIGLHGGGGCSAGGGRGRPVWIRGVPDRRVTD